MPYTAEISRTRPAAILFLLDQSASMQEPFGGAEQRGDAAPSRARVLADIVNKFLQDLILRCAKEDGVRDYFVVGVIGYGERVQPLIRASEHILDGEAGADAPWTQSELVPVSALAERPLRLEQRIVRTARPDGRGFDERRARRPVWFDPVASNGTPMCQAIDLATQIVREWVGYNAESFPPVVINVSDGEATDGDPLPYARHLQEYGTRDGETLLFNVHLSASAQTPIEFPDTIDGMPDAHARALYQMSSRLPFTMRSAAAAEGIDTSIDSRGFVFNADPAALVRFLEIGTRPGALR